MAIVISRLTRAGGPGLASARCRRERHGSADPLRAALLDARLADHLERARVALDERDEEPGQRQQRADRHHDDGGACRSAAWSHRYGRETRELAPIQPQAKNTASQDRMASFDTL